MNAHLILALALPAASVFGYKFGSKTGPEGWVEDHNYFRCRHGAEPVTWDADLAVKAQNWANHLAANGGGLVHSDSYNIWPYSGENLAVGHGVFNCNGVRGEYGQACAAWNWYNEYNQFHRCQGNWINVPSHDLGHYTAMVWKGIRSIGCGSAQGVFVCHYGHYDCKTPNTKMGGQSCWAGTPSKLANFNSNNCPSNGPCVDCFHSELVDQCDAQTSPTYRGGAVAKTTPKPVVVATTAKPLKTTTTTTTPLPPSSDEEVSSGDVGLFDCTIKKLVKAGTFCSQQVVGGNSFCDFSRNVPTCSGTNIRCGC